MANEYEFFKHCVSHISDENASSSYSLQDARSNSCKYDEQGWDQYHTNICEKLKKLIFYFQVKKNAKQLNEDSKYKEYLNFLVHFHLRQLENSKFDPSSFYNILREKDYQFFIYNFELTIHDIQKETFEKMKNIYNLYLKFYDIYKIIIHTDSSYASKCIGYAHECISLYETFLKTCSTPNVSSFCIALDNFKDTYDNLKSTEKCGNTELPSLPTYDDIAQRQRELQDSEKLGKGTADIPGYMSDSEKSQTSSQRETPFAIIGTVLGLGLVLPSLYRFTSLGPWFRRLIQRNNITNEKIEEEIYPLLHNSESEHTNSDIEQYNIAYNSME
ncbi:PIR Superfamily Protein [Plasmodium ovale wallikeri]|uniref:PIR Superfamily Protein n=1 Tax=Plasmodium ovale wallikeri TaxID=864142 RepID=A0A1A9AN46_PLAOA|nr:PIR Superfamily Protein [Plasmodium ovale wallikeri]SBT58093.1 PIR Superfamily Protein [Plasmodium ovale wallikeri]